MKKAVLVVSFGTSYAETREKTIGEIEREIGAAFSDAVVYRAFTSQMILDLLKTRDGIYIDNVSEAMERMYADGITEVLVQPTHVISGNEYDKMIRMAKMHEKEFHRVFYGRPLIADRSDYERVVRILIEQTRQYDEPGTDIIFMGHGTDHETNAVYTRLNICLKQAGKLNYRIGTVEATPSIEDLVREIGRQQVKRVVLLPLMIVAGDHAIHDMAGHTAASWKTQLTRAGYEVECVVRGLGEYPEIRQLIVEHAKTAVSAER